MDRKVKQSFELLKAFHDGLAGEQDIDVNELPLAKKKRIERLEKNDEEWFAYYFGGYAKAPPAAFHKAATRRVMGNPEWYEVRSWSRELAKSTRTMMETLKLVYTRKKKNVLITSNSKDNADRLLLPYQSNIEKNKRLINDYGVQESPTGWTAGEFTLQMGAAFRAVGAGQSPRGTRSGADRPDVILVDDIDTDEDCRNPDIIDQRWAWIEEALIGTRSISEPMLIIFCGNIIAEDCCITRAAKMADKHDIVNIRDANGKSTWPEKNSEEAIDRVLSKISESAQQKEYFNNPLKSGKTFPEITWGKCPPFKELQFVVLYADPAPSNKDRPGAKSSDGNSRKACFIIGRKGTRYYIYYGYLDVMGSITFINSLYHCNDYVAGRCPVYTYIENNSLQDPFYDQVYRPLIVSVGKERKYILGVLPDQRKKPEKWFRIEATLEPINTRGDLIFNEDERGNPHMLRLETHFKTARPTSKTLDGPDCIEGGVTIINEKTQETSQGAIRGTSRSRSETKGY